MNTPSEDLHRKISNEITRLSIDCYVRTIGTLNGRPVYADDIYIDTLSRCALAPETIQALQEGDTQ
jgi:hypothetical protein